MTRRFLRQAVITVNGPGEISGWLQPFSKALKRVAPDVRICAALLPCVFATGNETAVLAGLAEIDAVAGTRETLAAILRGRVPAAFDRTLPGCCLHFGGEPLLTALLARRLHYPAAAYAEKRLSWPRLFRRVYLTHRLRGDASHPERSKVIGNLMVDAAHSRCCRETRPAGSPPVIGIFAGSREYLVKNLLPFFVRVAGDAAPALPGARWLLGKSEFVTVDMLRRSAEDTTGRLIENESARWEEGGSLLSERGIRLEIVSPGSAMAQADLMLTVPGTNTAELAALGIPMIVVVPTTHAEINPLPGLLGHLDLLPVLGGRLKRAGAHVYHRRLGYLAYPNRIMQRAVVPEISGHVTSKQIAGVLVQTLARPLADMRRELLDIMGPPGGAVRLAEEVDRFLRSNTP